MKSFNGTENRHHKANRNVNTCKCFNEWCNECQTITNTALTFIDEVSTQSHFYFLLDNGCVPPFQNVEKKLFKCSQKHQLSYWNKQLLLTITLFWLQTVCTVKIYFWRMFYPQPILKNTLNKFNLKNFRIKTYFWVPIV